MILWRRGPFAELEKEIGYRFRRPALLRAALTHRSYSAETADSAEDNQRLEFLGDAVLGLAVAAHLYEKYRDVDEGASTSYRSQITSGKAIGDIAGRLQMGRFLLVGKGEERSGGRVRAKTLADALEAVLGAAYLDGGMAAANRIVARLFLGAVDNLDGDVWADNPKGKLQEVCQRRWRRSPTYRLVNVDGPAHALLFTVDVSVAERFSARGTGASKRDAETRAAAAALAQVGTHEK